VIVEFGGKSVSNLVEFSEALYSHKPGDEVMVTVVRGGERRQFRVKLTRRG
jgi:S1-C subfamily serine protease